MDTIKFLIVDDNLAIADVICEYLSTDPMLELVGVFKSMEHFLRSAPNIAAPDVVLMDIMLPGMNGIEGVQKTLRIWPDTKIIMNSVLTDSDAIYNSLIAGALGYVSKDMPLASIREAIITVHNGGSFMNAQIARKVVAYFQKSMSVRDMLTEREWSIANGINEGLSYKLVAAANDITIDGVRYHIQNIYRKLNINSKSELVKLLS
jgi:DNA-binding NarL/FixJ family response regulator